jgi:2-polyprenyl-3-methyl-5-hydroxy-6-metoxy-1,4-benzoquinol methylase
MFDVIEHIPQLENFLATQVHRILKKGGILVFQTPNKIINVPLSILQHKSLTHYQSYHCSLQTKRGINRVLHHAGFSQVARKFSN